MWRAMLRAGNEIAMRTYRFLVIVSQLQRFGLHLQLGQPLVCHQIEQIKELS
jgi:hypothetical protein